MTSRRLGLDLRFGWRLLDLDKYLDPVFILRSGYESLMEEEILKVSAI